MESKIINMSSKFLLISIALSFLSTQVFGLWSYPSVGPVWPYGRIGGSSILSSLNDVSNQIEQQCYQTLVDAEQFRYSDAQRGIQSLQLVNNLQLQEQQQSGQWPPTDPIQQILNNYRQQLYQLLKGNQISAIQRNNNIRQMVWNCKNQLINLKAQVWAYAGAGVGLYGQVSSGPSFGIYGQIAPVPSVGLYGQVAPVAQVGPFGQLGLVGPYGRQGLVGPYGGQGLVGPYGGQGLVGPYGGQGLFGPYGRQGLVGPYGGRGLVGPYFGQGLVGPYGGQGLVGPYGGQGLVGPYGGRGLVGPYGVQGLVGPVGGYGLRY